MSHSEHGGGGGGGLLPPIIIGSGEDQFLDTLAGHGGSEVSRTYDRYFNKPWKYKIEILDAREEETLYLSDGFDITSSNIIVEKIHVNQGEWETWDASIQIDDSVYRNLDPRVLDNGTVMKIYMGKTLTNLQPLFYGIIDKIQTRRTGAGRLNYTPKAKGFGVIDTYTLVDFQKVPPPETLLEGAHITDPKAIPFQAHNLMKSLYGDLDIMPMLDYTLSQRYGKNFSIEGIADTIIDFIPGLKYPLATASQIVNIVARMSGTVSYIDQTKKLRFFYPQGINSGHIIKDYETPGDSGDYTCYISPDSELSFEDSTAPEDGYANQIFAIAEKVDLQGVQAKSISFMSLYNKDLAWAVYPGSAKFKNMTFIMSKIGTGTDAPNPEVAKLYGYIVTDNNNSPTGEVVGTFSININDIPDTPSAVYKIDRPNFEYIDVKALHWIVFQEIGSSESNTVRIWNDDDLETPSKPGAPRLMATRFLPNGRSDNDTYSKRGWYIRNKGPMISIAFATTSNVIVEASNPYAIERWSPNRSVQARISLPNLKSVQASQRYADVLIQMVAQKIRDYGTMEVTIPNILLEPSTEVQIASDMIPDLAVYNNRVARIKNVSYDLDVYDYAVGSKYCKVALKGYVQPLS